MAIIQCIEINNGRDGSIEFPQDGIVKKQYKRIFQVETDDATDDAGFVVCEGQARGFLPNFYDPYVVANFSDPDCQCKNINPSPNSDCQYIWTVTCTFDNEPYLPASTPLCLPPVWSISFQRQKEAVEADVNGNAVLNSAMIPIALERDISILNIQVKWCSVNFFPPDLAAWQDTVNATLFHGFQPGTLKLDGLTVTEQIDPYRQGLGLGRPPGRYYEKNLSLSCKYTGWQAELLDAGIYKLDPRRPPVPGRTPNWLPCTDALGHPVTQPVPLDGFGQQLAWGRRPVFLTFEIYRPAEWNAPKLIDWPSITCPERNSLVCAP